MDSIKEKTIAERDSEVAEGMKDKVEDMLTYIKNVMDEVEGRMTDWNSPAFNCAIKDALKRGTNMGGARFDVEGAIEKFNEYYKEEK